MEASLLKEETSERLISAAIKKYNVTDKAINDLKKKCMGIKVLDAGDKKGYGLAHDTRIEVRNIRVQIEKTRIGLNKDALEYRNAVNGEAKRITGLLTPLEDHLAVQEKIVDDEKKRIEEQKVAEKKAKIDARVKTLTDIGMNFDAFSSYIYSYDESRSLSIEIIEITGLADKDFDDFVENLKVVVAEENKRLKEKEEKEAKVKADQEVEAKRLDEQKKEQDEKEAKIKADQEKIDNDKKAIEEEKQKREQEEATRIENEKIAKEAEEKAKKEADEKVAREKENERLEKEQTEKDEALRVARMPDNEKLWRLADTIEAIELPALTHKESHDILNEATDRLAEAYAILRQGKQ